MATITTRSTGDTAKGAALTTEELDNNFINLNDDKAELVSPIFTTPDIGAATATSVNGLGISNVATGATMIIADNSSFETVGAYDVVLTSTADTNVTLPTTGILVTVAGATGLTNKYLDPNTVYDTPDLGVATVDTINGMGIATTTGSTMALANNSSLSTTGAYNLNFTLSGDVTATVPAGTDTLVTEGATQSLSYKTLVNPLISGAQLTSSALGTLNTDASVTLDGSVSNYYWGTVANGATGVIFNVSPVPASNKPYIIYLVLSYSGGSPSFIWKSEGVTNKILQEGGVAPTPTGTTSTVDIFQLITYASGALTFVKAIAQDLQQMP